MGLSFATTGQWFVTGGFYVPDPKLQGQPMAIYEAIRQGLVDLAGPRFVQFTTWSMAIIVIAALLRRSWSGLMLPHRAGRGRRPSLLRVHSPATRSGFAMKCR